MVRKLDFQSGNRSSILRAPKTKCTKGGNCKYITAMGFDMSKDRSIILGYNYHWKCTKCDNRRRI